VKGQLARLQSFQQIYNHERPHEALGQIPPARVYTRSPRLWNGKLRSPDYWGASGFLGLHWRLFDFARVDAEVAAARGRNAEALAAYRLTVLKASEDVENAFSALVKQQAKAQILAEGDASLTKARASSYAAYKAGVSSLIDVLDADRRVLEDRDAEVQAQAAAAQAAVASFRALGGGWDAPGEQSSSQASAAEPAADPLHPHRGAHNHG